MNQTGVKVSSDNPNEKPAEGIDQEFHEGIKESAEKENQIKIFKVPSKIPKIHGQVEPIVALGLIRHSELQRWQYEGMLEMLEQYDHHIFPRYEVLEDIKKFCYPSNVTIVPQKAFIPLDDLVSHTTLRILEANQEDIAMLVHDDVINAKMELMIHMKDEGGSLMIVNINPLKMVYKRDVFLWESDYLFLSRSSRPLQMELAKLSWEYVKETLAKIEEEISKLSSHRYIFDTGMTLNVSYSFKMAESINEFQEDGYEFSTGSMRGRRAKIFLDNLIHQKLEYSDPLLIQKYLESSKQSSDEESCDED